MIVIEFEQTELNSFNECFENTNNKDIVTTKKLNGDEILFQSILTISGAVIPFIIQFFLNQRKKNKKIKIIKKGIEFTFDSEKDLKKFLKDYLKK